MLQIERLRQEIRTENRRFLVQVLVALPPSWAPASPSAASGSEGEMTDTDRQRLAAILGMLGSEHAGERAAAALQAEAFRRHHNLTWAELLAAKPPAAPEPPQWTPPPPPPPPRPAPFEFVPWTPVPLTPWKPPKKAGSGSR